jgi:hypothetical protein
LDVKFPPGGFMSFIQSSHLKFQECKAFIEWQRTIQLDEKHLHQPSEGNTFTSCIMLTYRQELQSIKLAQNSLHITTITISQLLVPFSQLLEQTQ